MKSIFKVLLPVIVIGGVVYCIYANNRVERVFD